MKKFLLTLVVVLAAISAFAENKVAYGILTLDETEYRKVNSLVSFPLEGNFTTYNQIVQFGKTDVFAGAYANDAYYAETIKTNEIGAEVPDSLLRVDVKTGKYTRVGVLSGFSNKINDMSYDYATSTMWAIAVNSDFPSVILHWPVLIKVTCLPSPSMVTYARLTRPQAK